MASEKKGEPVAMEVEKGEVVGLDGVGSSGSGMRTAEMLLRVVPMGLCVAALIVMIKNQQSNDYGSVSYSDLSGFKYLVFVNGVCATYSLFSAFFTARSRQLTVAGAWGFYVTDQILAYVVLTAASASAEILYLAYKGDQEVTWSEACSTFGGFCNKAKVSVGITFATVLCYVCLSLVSSFRLFSSFEAPIPFLSKGPASPPSPADEDLKELNLKFPKFVFDAFCGCNCK